MNARSPAAFMLSATLHAFFAAAMFFVAYSMRDEVTKPSKTFELVAGEGDNYAATVAAALGSPDGSEVEFPNLPPTPAPPALAPTPPTPEPVVAAEPEPSPVQAIAPPKETPPPVPPKKTPPKPKPEPSPVTKAAEPKKTEPLVPDLKRSMLTKQKQMAAQQKRAREKAAKAAAALAAKQAEIAARKAALTQGGGGQTNVKKIDAKGIAQGVLGGSTENTKGGAGGTALSREEQDLQDAYMNLLTLRMAEAHEKPVGLSDNLVATAEIYLAASGAVSRVKIVKSSGNAEFDQSVLEAIRNFRTIGPRPDGKSSTYPLLFRMKDPE